MTIITIQYLHTKPWLLTRVLCGDIELLLLGNKKEACCIVLIYPLTRRLMSSDEQPNPREELENLIEQLRITWLPRRSCQQKSTRAILVKLTYKKGNSQGTNRL